MECEMWNGGNVECVDVECGMWNVTGGMWNVECGKWNVASGMWNGGM